jgi:hypothetical protein
VARRDQIPLLAFSTTGAQRAAARSDQLPPEKMCSYRRLAVLRALIVASWAIERYSRDRRTAFEQLVARDVSASLQPQ